MVQFLFIILGVASVAIFWSLYTMKKDGYFDDKETKRIGDRPKKGSIIFFRDSVKHVK